MARGDLIDVGYGQMASPRTMCKSGFVWRYANTLSEAISSNSDIIEVFPYILRTATNYTPYSNDLRNSYVQITIGSATTTQYLKTKYNFGNVSPINTKFYLTSTYNNSNPFGYGTPDSTTYVTSTTIDGKTVYGARFPVPHNTDGTAPTVSVKWLMVNSSSHSNIEKTESLTLDTIPRASQPTCAGGSLDSSITINTNRASTSFTHTINIKVGGTTRETFNNIGEYKDWSPSYSTYLPIISGTSATATIECITYSGSTNIGTANTTCVVSVPDNATTKPTASISIAKGDNVVPAGWGVYVKGKSKLLVTITSEPKAGTTSTSYTSTANGSPKTGSLSYDSGIQKYKATYTTSELTGDGSVTATVTDGRYFSKAATPVSYTVVDYSNPQITTATVARCTSNGTLSDEGTYVKYSFVGSISSVSNKNSKTFKVRYKQSGGSYSDVYSYTSGYSVNQVDVIFGSGNIDITKEYVFRFEATDSFTTTAKEVEVGTVADLMNFNPSGKSMAFGGVSTRDATESVIDFKTTAQFKDVIVENIKSKNIFNTYMVIGDYAYADGSIVNNLAYCRSDAKIPVTAGKTYTLSYTTSQTITDVGFVFFNNNTYVSYTNGSATITIPSGVNYVGINLGTYPSNFDITDISNVQLEEGSASTTYTPYQELNPDNFKNEEIVVGSIRSKNIVDEKQLIAGIYKIGDGTYDYNATNRCTANKIEIDNTKDYVLSATGPSGYNMYVMFYNSSGTYLGYLYASYSIGKIRLGSYSNYSNAKYVNLRLEEGFSNLMLETGSIATNYMPYQNLDGKEIYSTSEIKIGTFLGKPLYRKVIQGTTVDGDLTIDLTSLNIDTLTDVRGMTVGGRPLNFDYFGYTVSTRYSSGLMYVFASAVYANDKFNMIIEYTKTTD